MGNNYWIGKKVFITGINGFIGGNLCKILVEKGANVFGLIRNHNKGTFLFNEGLSDSVVLINGELIDKDLICRIISEEQINVVYHLAALADLDDAQNRPYDTMQINVIGNINFNFCVNLENSSNRKKNRIFLNSFIIIYFLQSLCN